MSEAEIIFSLQALASDLQVAGERVPLDRVVKRHRQALSRARDAGLPWEALARLLAKTGARRSSGEPFSSHQLRASFARATKGIDGHELGRDPQPVADGGGGVRRTPKDLAPARPSEHRRKRPSQASPASAATDVSDIDIEAARKRLG